LLEQAVEVRRSIGDPDALASALKQMGTLVFDRGDYVEARRFYEESVEVRGPDGDPVGIAETLNNLGVLARFEDDWDRAADHYERALVLFRTSHDGVGVARALMNLGEARMERGELESAAALCRESLALCIEVGSRWDVTDILEELGPIAHLAGDSVLGAQLIGAAEALREDLGTPLPESEQPIVAKRVAGIRDALGPARFEREAEVGRQMGFDAAVALAGGVTGKHP
jgi:tetratricopeptide (TPR) repeat protein